MKENLRIWAVENGGSRDSHGTDVTAAVQALYDLAIHSMDYGSGFWSAEDAEPVALLARICGFNGREGIEKYIESERFLKERAAFLASFSPEARWQDYSRVPHEHQYAVVNGKCMWPACPAKKEGK